MKQERRHELKTNDLSVYLQQLADGTKKYSTHILTGVVIVVLVLVIAMLYQRNRDAATQAAWDSIANIQQTDPIEKPEVLEQSRGLMTKYMDDPALGPAVINLHGSKLYETALQKGKLDQKQERVKLLEEARDTYGKLIDKYAQRKYYLAMGQMMLALAEESLVVEGEGKMEAVRELYNKRLASDNPMYKKLAEQHLASLDQRLEPLNIVPTPEPAEKPEGDESPEAGPDASDNGPLKFELNPTDALEKEPAPETDASSNE